MYPLSPDTLLEVQGDILLKIISFFEIFLKVT